MGSLLDFVSGRLPFARELGEAGTRCSTAQFSRYEETMETIVLEKAWCPGSIQLEMRGAAGCSRSEAIWESVEAVFKVEE